MPSYYAIINAQSIVTSVFPGKTNGESGIADWEAEYSKITGQTCKRTAMDGSIRKNFAGIGYSYNATIDAFVPPIPGSTDYWELDTTTARWKMTPAGSQYYIVEAVKGHIQFIVSQRQYDSIVSLISYLQSPNPQWAAEAAAGNVWNSAVWAKVVEIQQQVASGQRPIPTPTEVIAELPVIQWPS